MDKLEVFKQRAEVLKQVLPRESKSEKIAVLTFYLADEVYALEAEYVKKVVALKKYTALPCTPDYILGIVNEASRILAVVDIKKLFKLANKGITNLNRVILLKYNGIEFGVLADEIIGREEYDAIDFQANLPEIAGIKTELIKGVTTQRVIVLNTRELINDERLHINEKI